ncbi:MAG: MaoC family dehydratase [Actinomycetia bacterium]|nr:MaoC family dehydratase [Actinomycetes bacterium]
MSEAAATALAKIQERVGTEEGVGEWFEITQDMINQFADLTEDHQFIHVDEEGAKSVGFPTTIAHGFLTLSMLTHGAASIPQDPELFRGIAMGMNYGFDKVRFVNPVPNGSRLRCRSVLSAAEPKGDNAIHLTRTYTMEIEGADKPALVADWIVRLQFA